METIKKKLLTGFIFIRRKALLILFIGMTIVLLTYVFGLFKEISSPIIPSASPVAEVSPVPKRIPSSLATELGFLKLEEDLKLLEQDLTSVDLSESKLSLPILEMKVNFEK
ncbi:hypothetical protein HY946_00115 [Candidatus Gottesmanbacteria bacterium]|nr:hypothetical protein [Candidatus Gottesmanbacteria bacterium]